MTIALFTPQGFALAGVVQAPTVDGPLKMRAPAPRLPATHPGRRGGVRLAARPLDLRGNVTERALVAPDVIATDGLRLEAS
ncbi:hypothetical protein [Streptomyces sp. NPDC085540]|uniref:hypothetical protein n=1 Tax=Streptomyces sp. NPDC085540 TaxID=3365730 RepID=UPI0037CCE6FA